MNIFSTNKQLRKEVKALTETIRQVRDSHYHTTKYAAKLEVEQRSLLRQIEFLTPKKIVTKAPSRPVEARKPTKGYIPSHSVSEPFYPTVRKEDDSNSVNSFLASAAIGYVIGEVFSNDSSSSNSSSSSSSSDSISSGGGGDFGGGGASSDW